MFVVVNQIPIVDGRADELVDVFEQRTTQLRNQPGLKSVELLRPVDAENYLIKAYWESRAAFEQWRESEAFQAVHEDLPEGLFAGPNQIDIYERTVEIET